MKSMGQRFLHYDFELKEFYYLEYVNPHTLRVYSEDGRFLVQWFLVDDYNGPEPIKNANDMVFVVVPDGPGQGVWKRAIREEG